MIGQVDAVICATDIGAEHVERCRPFVEAGIPLFIDKPLTDNEDDLKTICRWVENGAKIQSSSSLRYNKSLEPFFQNRYELGSLRFILSPMAKYWETYGMHAIEAFFHLVGCGFEWVENLGTYEKPFVNLYHKDDCHVTIPMNTPAPGLWLCGEYMSKNVASGDSYYSFKRQLEVFVDYLRTGERPFPFEQTIECCKILIAGIRSREEGGRRVYLSEINER
jgi:predicted dehydrogenase